MGAHRRPVSTLLQRWLATEVMNGNYKSKVGRQQNFTINSVEFDNEELNMGLMFTNKALQIMTPIYMLMKITTPLKSNILQE